MAAPFERAFEDFATLRDEAAKFTSESAPEGIKEGGEVMAIHYREEEAIYIKASHDRVTVIFSTIFREETDRIFGKVFLQVRSALSLRVFSLSRVLAKYFPSGVRRRTQKSNPKCPTGTLQERSAPGD